VIRRLAGVALGAFLLHLNVVRADLACATHSHDASARMSHEHDAPASHGMSMHGEHTVDASTSCDAPLQADCCQTLVTCSVALGLGTDTGMMSARAVHDVVHAVPQSAPTSRTGAPEPPPPKA